jgi:hypothetical protein
MAFRDGVGVFTARVRNTGRVVFTILKTETQAAVTVGNPRSGSPGQPVQSGRLRASFIPEDVNERTWQTTTNLPYARAIEDGVGPHGPLTLRSPVGGFHSIKLLRLNWSNVVAYAVAQAKGGG